MGGSATDVAVSFTVHELSTCASSNPGLRAYMRTLRSATSVRACCLKHIIMAMSEYRKVDHHSQVHPHERCGKTTLPGTILWPEQNAGCIA